LTKLVLASISPRRRALLKTLGFPFEVVAPLFQEESTHREAEEECLYFAEMKARSVTEICPDAWVLGSDTIVINDKQILGKPINSEEAMTMLRSLSGKQHRVCTAIVLLNTKQNTIKKHLAQTKVFFREISNREIRDYVKTQEPLDKAGAYAIQGGADQFVTKIEGDIETVIGLPTSIVKEWLIDTDLDQS
jgi:septum formation protein